MPRTSKPTVIELFAGAGLLSEAFRQVGCEIVAAYELDPKAAESYTRNIGKHIACADLATARPNGHCDVLVAGPPCQGFSTLGKRDPSDPRNSLSLIVPKWAQVLTPKAIVIENVAVFAESDIHLRVCKSLVKLGYEVNNWVLNAADYGAAQYRTRSFTVAHKGLCSLSSPRRRAGKTVREAWKGVSKIRDDGIMSHSPRPSELALSRFRVTPPGGDKRSIMSHAPHLAPKSWWVSHNAVTDVWGRIQWDRPSNTLRTAFQNPSKGRYVHPELHRVITLREGARLQGIPDKWKFSGRPTQIARQIGNGVPLPLGRAVARSVVNSLAT